MALRPTLSGGLPFSSFLNTNESQLPYIVSKLNANARCHLSDISYLICSQYKECSYAFLFMYLFVNITCNLDYALVIILKNQPL